MICSRCKQRETTSRRAAFCKICRSEVMSIRSSRKVKPKPPRVLQAKVSLNILMTKHKPKPVSDGQPSWWQRRNEETPAEHRDRFYREVHAREADLQASTFGRILGRPTLGPNQVTTMQVNRWRREE